MNVNDSEKESYEDNVQKIDILLGVSISSKAPLSDNDKNSFKDTGTEIQKNIITI